MDIVSHGGSGCRRPHKTLFQLQKLLPGSSTRRDSIFGHGHWQESSGCSCRFPVPLPFLKIQKLDSDCTAEKFPLAPRASPRGWSEGGRFLGVPPPTAIPHAKISYQWVPSGHQEARRPHAKLTAVTRYFGPSSLPFSSITGPLDRCHYLISANRVKEILNATFFFATRSATLTRV